MPIITNDWDVETYRNKFENAYYPPSRQLFVGQNVEMVQAVWGISWLQYIREFTIYESSCSSMSMWGTRDPCIMISTRQRKTLLQASLSTK